MACVSVCVVSYEGPQAAALPARPVASHLFVLPAPPPLPIGYPPNRLRLPRNRRLPPNRLRLPSNCCPLPPEHDRAYGPAFLLS